MKQKIPTIAAALAVAFCAGAMAGCAPQPEPTPSTVSGSLQEEELVAELKQAIADAPSYESVTMTQHQKRTFHDGGEDDANANAPGIPDYEDSSDRDPNDWTGIYKFDYSGGTLRTSSGDEQEGYFSDNGKAVYVSNGEGYSGTTEQLDMTEFAGVEEMLSYQLGDWRNAVDYIATISKEESDGKTTYTLVLDPDKYNASGETLADLGDPVLSATLSIGFDGDGHIISIIKEEDRAASGEKIEEFFSDFDSTVVEPLPEATHEYSELLVDPWSQGGDIPIVKAGGDDGEEGGAGDAAGTGKIESDS